MISKDEKKEILIQRLMHSEMFARTPKIACKFMAKLIPSTKKLKVLDMFAGNGNITKEINPMHEIYAVE